MKDKAKGIIKKDFKKILIALIPLSVLYFLTDITNTININENNTFISIINIICSLAYSFLMLGIIMTCLDSVNNNNKLSNNLFKDQFSIFNKKYLWPTIKLCCMSLVLIFAWTLLFVIPGIIKSFSYSQSFFIMKEHIDNNEKVTARQCITESRKLMNEHKFDYFILMLSFIGWEFLASLIIGLSSILVSFSIIFAILEYLSLLFFMVLFFYIYYSQAIFYKELKKQQ